MTLFIIVDVSVDPWAHVCRVYKQCCRALLWIGLSVFLPVFSASAVDLNDVIIYAENDPPYVLVDAQNNVTGGTAGGKVLQVLTALQLPSSTIHIVPWSRGYNEAITRPNVMIFPIAKTKERLKSLDYTFKVADSEVFFYKLKSSSTIKLTKVDDAKPYSVCAIINDYRYDYLLDQGFSKLDTSVDEFTALRKFLGSRCDLILLSERGMMSKLAKMGVDSGGVEKSIKPDNLDSGLYAAFNKNTAPAVIEAFKNAAKKLN